MDGLIKINNSLYLPKILPLFDQKNILAMEISYTTLLQILNLIATILSFIRTIVMSYYCIINLSTNSSIKLILALALSDFFYTVSNVMMPFDIDDGSTECVIEGLIRDFFFKFSMCLAVAIAIFHYKIITAKTPFDKTPFIVKSILASLLISLIITLRYLLFTIALNL